MKTVKALVVVSVLLAVLPAVPVRASMQILSESYHVECNVKDVSWYDVVGSYDVTRPFPSASGGLTFTDISGRTLSWGSLATRYSVGPDIFFRAEQHGWCPICLEGSMYGSPRASLVVDFTIGGPVKIEAWREVGPYGWAEAKLTRLTDGMSWDLLSPSHWSYLVFWEVPVETSASMVFPFCGDDVYRLEMAAYPPEWHNSSITVKFGPVIVPAPGAILLGTLGAGLVGLLRRRRAL